MRIEKLERLGGNPQGGVVFAGMLLPGRRIVAAAEWTFRIRGERSNKKSRRSPGEPGSAGGGGKVHDQTTLLKQVASIEQEMSSVQKANHPNLVPYLGMGIQKHPACVKLVLLEEFVFGSDMSFVLSENIALELDLLQYVASGVLQVLSYMHGVNIVHRDLRDTSIFLDRGRLVRVAGFSVDKRVRDLLQQDGEEEDRFPQAAGRGAKKTDVYRFGLLLLSLAKGEVAQDSTLPKDLNPVLEDFLRKCLWRDERDRWSAAQLLEHRWLKQRPEKALLGTTEGRDDAQSPEPDDETGPAPVPFLRGSGESRLQSEFDFISKIGKGGFGEVMKVKNRLDGQVYAIKKIKLNRADKPSTRKLMREVKLLSRLNHENVVRYYTSWIEAMEVTAVADEDDEEEQTASSEEPQKYRPRKETLAPKKTSLLDQLNVRLDTLPLPAFQTESPSEKEISISFTSKYGGEDEDEPSDGDEDEDDSDDLFGTSFLPESEDNWGGEDSSHSGVVFECSQTEGESEGPGETSTGEKAKAGKVNKEGKAVKEIHLMYIQMEYCDKQTLRNAIDSGLYKDTQRGWRMFRVSDQGVCLTYIPVYLLPDQYLGNLR